MKLYRLINSKHTCPFLFLFVENHVQVHVHTFLLFCQSLDHPCSPSVALVSILCWCLWELLIGRYLFNGHCSPYKIIMYMNNDDKYTPKRISIYLNSQFESILCVESSYGLLLSLSQSVCLSIIILTPLHINIHIPSSKEMLSLLFSLLYSNP